MIRINEALAARHFRRLLGIAKRHGVQVHFVPGLDLDWEGLYILDSQSGPGIALRNGLPSEWRAWVLAHELGHHLASIRFPLFSPFGGPAPAVNPANHGRKRRRLDTDEEFADDWAASTLIDDEDWVRAEDVTPLSLDVIAARLGLPAEAALAWESLRRRQKRLAGQASFAVDAIGLRAIEQAALGHGGHQSLFRRLRLGTKANRLSISFNDFSLARERVLTVQGGWLIHYRLLLAAVEPSIATAGGVSRLFSLA